MLLVLYAAVVVLFPVGAVWAHRRRGNGGLVLISAAAVGTLMLLALLAASETGGNRLAATRGYVYTASRVLHIATLTAVLPVLAAASAVWAAGVRWRSGAVVAIAMTVAFVAAVLGIVVAVYTMF